MANISPVDDQPFRMFGFALSQSHYGTITQQSSTSVTIDMNGVFVGITNGMSNRFLGTGLSYDEQNDRFTGVVTGFEHLTNGVIDFRVTGLNVGAPLFEERFSNNMGVDGIGFLLFGTDDVFTGSTGNDQIMGYAGNDTINGAAGNDTISAESPSIYPPEIKGSQGDGHDVVNGGEGGDSIRGGGGNDHLYGFGATAGPDGNDTISAGDGYDYIQGNAGDDRLTGGAGIDRIQGGAGNDTISGEGEPSGDTPGNDTINGNRGNDTIDGGPGNDLIRGGQDNDNLFGGLGNDLLFGDLGDDILRGGIEPDTLTGGAGADHFLFTQGAPGSIEDFAAAIHITDFQDGLDRIVYETSNPTSVVSVGVVFSASLFRTAVTNMQPNSNSVYVASFGDDTIFYRPGCKVVFLDGFNHLNLSLSDFVI